MALAETVGLFVARDQNVIVYTQSFIATALWVVGSGMFRDWFMAETL
jgi:hypothetical protein